LEEIREGNQRYVDWRTTIKLRYYGYTAEVYNNLYTELESSVKIFVTNHGLEIRYHSGRRAAQGQTEKEMMENVIKRISSGDENLIHWAQKLQLVEDSCDNDTAGSKEDVRESLHGYPEEVYNNLYKELESSVEFFEVNHGFEVQYRNGVRAAGGQTSGECINNMIKQISEGDEHFAKWTQHLQLVEGSSDDDTVGSRQGVTESQPEHTNEREMQIPNPSSKCDYSTASSSSTSGSSQSSSEIGNLKIVTDYKPRRERSQRSTPPLYETECEESHISPKRLFHNDCSEQEIHVQDASEQELNNSASQGTMAMLSEVRARDKEFDQDNLLNNFMRIDGQNSANSSSSTNSSSHTSRKSPPGSRFIDDQAQGAGKDDDSTNSSMSLSSKESATSYKSPSQNQIDGNIMSPVRLSPNGRRTRIPYTDREKHALLKGYKKFGRKWAKILADNSKIFEPNRRSNVDLKDLHRILSPNSSSSTNSSSQTSRKSPPGSNHFINDEFEDNSNPKRRQRIGDVNDQLAQGPRTSTKNQAEHGRRTRIPYTEREKLALLKGYKKFGSEWAKILKDNLEIFEPNRRSNINLKDLHRTLAGRKPR